jgi:hypothetical protein
MLDDKSFKVHIVTWRKGGCKNDDGYDWRIVCGLPVSRPFRPLRSCLPGSQRSIAGLLSVVPVGIYGPDRLLKLRNRLSSRYLCVNSRRFCANH